MLRRGFLKLVIGAAAAAVAAPVIKLLAPAKPLTAERFAGMVNATLRDFDRADFLATIRQKQYEMCEAFVEHFESQQWGKPEQPTRRSETLCTSGGKPVCGARPVLSHRSLSGCRERRGQAPRHSKWNQPTDKRRFVQVGGSVRC